MDSVVFSSSFWYFWYPATHQLKNPLIFCFLLNLRFKPLSCSFAVKCFLNGITTILPLVNNVSSVMIGKWLVLITVMNTGMNVISSWYIFLAVIISFPVNCLISAASNLILCGGSGASTNLTPLSLAISLLADLESFFDNANDSGCIVVP